jgi:hypothetical protein
LLQRVGVIGTAAVAALAVAGCAGSERTQEEGAGGAVHTLILACAGDRPVEASEVLDEPARQAFLRAPTPLDGCLEVLGLRFERLPPTQVRQALRRTRVVSVRANDVSASAALRAPGGRGATVEVENERGNWRVALTAPPAEG